MLRRLVNNGFSTHILRVLDETVVVITLGNLSTPGAGKLEQELEKLALGIPLPEAPKEISIAPEKFALSHRTSSSRRWWMRNWSSRVAPTEK